MKQALKEWAIAVDALGQGDLVLLLRKGGIREQKGQFQVAHPRVWLYPTYEHQQPRWLKQPYCQQVEPVPSGWHPTQVSLTCWAEITHVFAVTDAAIVMALQPFHIWNQQFVIERLSWKAHQPLYVLGLRVHQLDGWQIPYDAAYGGCRSWIDLQGNAPVDWQHAQPVLTDREYNDRLQAIAAIVSPSS